MSSLCFSSHLCFTIFLQLITNFLAKFHGKIAGAQFEGDLGEILALGAEILPYIGLREKWESP